MTLDSYKVLFWDFDGVIKDSLDVKTRAFVSLFQEYGGEISEKIKNHHLTNGGMSRFEKIPLYAHWCGLELSDKQVQDYSMQFSQIAFQGVLNSDWVPGAESYLRENKEHQDFVLVSATPHDELNAILQALDLQKCFKSSFGSPTPKREAIANTLKSLSVLPSECIMIGDARADMDAAYANSVDFLLRRHSSNAAVFEDYLGPSITGFI
jgi:phosphoglycolate phosphatase-like HAD superfamily hydrolase